MLNEFRSTSITWDKATRRIYSPITANASDSNGRKLNIQVVNSGQVENLTGATLHLYWETKDKAQHGLDAFTASDISKGEFEIFYTTGMLSNVGELNATLVLVDATGQVVSDWFKITVARGIDGDAIQSENSFTTLTQALIDISNLEQNYTPRLNDLTAQLAQLPTKEEINSQIGNLADATPKFAEDVDGMDDTTKPYVNLSDGYLYSFDGSNWVSTGVKYQGEGISDNSVGLDKLSKSDLITEYVKGQGSLNLSTIEKGKYEVNLASKGDLFITNGNMFDVLKATGTHSHGGLTITVTDNTVKITGTSSSNLFGKISDGLLITGGNTELAQRDYKLPAINNFAIGLYNKTINAPSGLTINVRNKDGGNIASLPVNSVQPYGNFPYSEKWGALYLYMPAGSYDVTFDVFIMPNTYVEDNRVQPYTKIIENVRKARLEIKENERLITSLSGTAIPLINIYENLQKVQENPQNKQIYVESHTNYFYHYIKGSNKDSNKYLRYRFEHHTSEATKADGWVQTLVDTVELVGGMFNYLYPVIVAGEWEMAVRIQDRPDFIGTKEHGSEINAYEKFYVDGSKWTPDESTFWCNEIRVIQKTDMYDPLDDATPIGQALPIGKHIKNCSITQNGMNIKQKIEWLNNFTMDMSYVTMLPIARGEDSASPYLISQFAYDDYNLEEIDISYVGHNAKTYDKNAVKWFIHSNKTGISAEVESLIKDKPSSASTFIQNTDKYNKVYFTYCNTGHAVNNGDIWEWESNYKLNISV